ncbi:metal ABC transporter substrate-binding protein [Entomospira entomophila]|uniref:Zinc ABC transporter substrate-binding protein n=1 Tax=Entomospira entomophila TaxID=2719988 RepID=A0A968GBZ4_9SPIO|nr:metal ABC transporter substrate-binding protein [Entomospira entomophilus]NIZ40586.1 zinc ABC transporter substrate-binding protein [Entomospira entomophilus]WDI34801.1 metal ABC transporter substrate-binding protein [Entomospira entomophilus]
MLKQIHYILLLGVLILGSCQKSDSSTKDSSLPEVYTTLFLTYDFAKAIAGDKMTVSLFLPLGIDTHTYEPSANDMLKAKNASLFLWTSDSMEPWMRKIEHTLQLSSDVSVNLADTLHLHALNEESSHDHEHHHGDHHHHENDPHFWMDPQLLLDLFDSIESAIIQRDPDNAEYYQANAQRYRYTLVETIDTLTATIASTENPLPILFGGGFSHQYFLDAYKLPFYTVYATDSIENEPTIAHMATIREAISTHNLRYIFVDPILTTKIADTLAQDYNLTILPWYTGHTLTKEEFTEGHSYIEMLQSNNINLKRALQQ